VFGDATGDPVADRLLEAIGRSGPSGLSYTEQSREFGRHVKAERLNTARQALERRDLIVTERRETEGRTETVNVTSEHAKEANDAKEGPST
jgi:hypothetical protein